MSEHRLTSRTIRANLIAGVLTVIPLLVVWIVLDFVFAILFAVGSPVASGFIMFITDRVPTADPILTNPVFQWVVAIICALLLLYTIGSIASRVVGKKVIELIETLIARIPVRADGLLRLEEAHRRCCSKSRTKARSIVLIDYPHPGMKTIGLVTRVFPDSKTGEELAAVYVPTAFNPTAGFLQIVPMSSLLPTSMTMDQAMTMIVSAGAMGPERSQHRASGAKVNAAGWPRASNRACSVHVRKCFPKTIVPAHRSMRGHKMGVKRSVRSAQPAGADCRVRCMFDQRAHAAHVVAHADEERVGVEIVLGRDSGCLSSRYADSR